MRDAMVSKTKIDRWIVPSSEFRRELLKKRAGVCVASCVHCVVES